VIIKDFEGHVIQKKLYTADWDIEAAEKGGYPHFMLKEIFEQPKAIRDTVHSRIQGHQVVFEDPEILKRLSQAHRIHIVACGTAMHAGVVGRHCIEKYAHVGTEVEIASEFRYRDPILEPSDCVIIISQSGETSDTVAALRLAKARNAFVIAIVNVVGSTIAREADSVLYTWAGPEIAVASTKAYTVQLSLLMLITIGLSRSKGLMSAQEESRYLDLLEEIPNYLEEMGKDTTHIQYIASLYQNTQHLFFIGRELDYALSVESSLKLKEISYIHSEAYAAGELKHGTLALVEKGTPVIAIALQQDVFEKTASNIKEVKARGARVLLVCREGSEEISELYDDVLFLPNVDDLFMPLIGIFPMQLFAYHTAVLRGCDVDKPRNLAKSVTVE
jgi:glucosamine--fructose-6-phosphate aminotransferase (isomerizing)